ncbi:MAG: hypothetical protein Kow00127_10750 [Bacteroidales bacterium]
MEQNSTPPEAGRQVIEFITVAHDYCLTMNNPEKQSFSGLTEYLARVLPLIYIKASLLPEVRPSNPDLKERVTTEENWENLFNELRNIFGKMDLFSVIDLTEGYDEPKRRSLAELLTDIFQEMNDFLALYQKNTRDSRENAVSMVREGFFEGWGAELIMAMQQLHRLMSEKSPGSLEFNRIP